MIATNALRLDDLRSHIEIYLVSDEELLKSNFVLIQNVAENFGQFKLLSKFYKESYQQGPSLIFKANDFTTIKSKYLLAVLTENKHSLNQLKFGINL